VRGHRRARGQFQVPQHAPPEPRVWG
jgi:hypothetical protein